VEIFRPTVTARAVAVLLRQARAVALALTQKAGAATAPMSAPENRRFSRMDPMQGEETNQDAGLNLVKS
jgi:hypothetical protein